MLQKNKTGHKQHSYMKITAALIDKLIKLRSGEKLPSSALRGEWVEELIGDGVLVSRSHGSRRSIMGWLPTTDRKTRLSIQVRQLKTASFDTVRKRRFCSERSFIRADVRRSAGEVISASRRTRRGSSRQSAAGRGHLRV